VYHIIMMREGSPEVTDIIDHVEYARIEKLETHIPEAKFEYVNGKPMALHVEGRKYEVRTVTEKTNSKDYFHHETAYYPDGTVKSLTFENHDVRDYFAELYIDYRLRIVSKLYKDMADDLHMQNYDKVGGYTNTFDERLDNFQLRTRRRAALKAEVPDLTAMGMIDAAGSEIGRLAKNLYREYFPKKREKITEIESRQVNFLERDALYNLTEDFIQWVDELQKSELPITIQSTMILTGRRPIDITRTIIGNLQVSARGKNS
jgi:hypothetical protein